MTHEEIRAAILESAELRALIEQGNDEGAAIALSASAAPVPTGELHTERSLFASLGPVMAESILGKLEQFSTSGASGASVIARGLSWLSPANGGIDFQNQDLRWVLSGLQITGVLTEQELLATQSLGVRPQSVTAADVGEAVAIWRPNGTPQPIPEN
jgi:hypothetical protein